MAKNNNFIPRNKANDLSDVEPSATFLPALYRTDANKKFLHSTINQLTQPGLVNKITGYIGRQNSKATSSTDIFVDAPTDVRQNYQLEPGFIIDDTLDNTVFLKDYQDYINQLRVFGADVSNHSKLSKQEFYSWNPHVNWDKLVNFQNYYWMPHGPDTITIQNTETTEVISTYTVETEITDNGGAYIITPDGLTRNPVIALYRGHTYKFVVNSLGNPFTIKTQRTSNPLDRYVNAGLINNSIEKGTITFTVPSDAPDELVYVSENDIDLGGVFNILNLGDSAYINVESEIIGKRTYRTNGIDLSNGMRVQFAGNVYPKKYASGRYFVEGVGDKIQLINEADLEIITTYTTTEAMLFDNTLFDTTPFSDSVAYTTQPDYIVINRGSADRNFWSRNNKWVHKDVIEKSAQHNGVIALYDQSMRAVRAIIEFEKNLKLFNFGTAAIMDIAVIDNYTRDAFSIVEGSLGYNVDGVDLAHGQYIIFTADTDVLVKNNIYRVNFIDVKHTTNALGKSNSQQIQLELVAYPIVNQVVLVSQGKTSQGKMYWYDGVVWQLGQQKVKANQFPLFDIADIDGVSFGDKSVYPGTTFKGTTLFSYKVGNSSIIDPNLGFALSYKNIDNIGDIVFNFSLLTDTFTYELSENIITKQIDTGFLISSNNGTISYVNGWEISDIDISQAAIRLYRNSNLTNNFDIDIFDELPSVSDIEVRVYVNNVRTDKWTLASVNSANVPLTYHQVVFDTDVSTADVVMIKVFSMIAINTNGYYEIPINLQNNSMNGVLTEFTLGEVIDHVNSIVDNVYSKGFSGVFPGVSNLRDLGKVTKYGTKFVQHSGPASLSFYHITSETNNIIRAIDQSRDDYCRFKRAFLIVANELGVDTDTINHVDLILQKMNKDVQPTAPYYFSDMVPYGSKLITNFTVAAAEDNIFSLATLFNLTELSHSAVNVYLNNVQLLHGKDYTFSDQGFVLVSASLEKGDIVSIYEYESTDGCMIPETPTKLGLWPKYEPKKYLDTTLLVPQNMIQGHDGSLVLAYNDFRDDLILELEKRIYNNIKISYDPSVFDINDVIPSYIRKTDYSLSQFNNVIMLNFYNWSLNAGVDFSTVLTYDKTNSFTFNYTNHSAPDGRVTPGYWRGIYQWMLDTDRPHICPWEMLGFTEEPAWWTTVYGPAPYTRNNLVLWDDISKGLVKEPGKPVKLEKYVRPFLLSHIPVDDDGNLISPANSNLARGILTQSFQGDFNFGDVSPIEAAWRRHSHFAFSVIKTAILLSPASTIGTLLDRSRISRNLAGQLVYANTGIRITPTNLILPSVYLSNTRNQTAGLLNYLINYMKCDDLTQYNKYKLDLDTITTKLLYRVSAFTSKEKFNLLLDSKSPIAVGSIFIPQEDYKVVLNTSSPISILTYSGVVITRIENGFEIKGYSKLQPYFKYFTSNSLGQDVNVAGISEGYVEWTAIQSYYVGNIVKYGNSFYRTIKEHISGYMFDETNFIYLKQLPIVGGVTASFKYSWNTVSKKLPYGSRLGSIQEVVDFLLGYGAWLTNQGFLFDTFNTKIDEVANWETSAKEFMFWTTQNWTTPTATWQEWQSGIDLSYGDIIRYNGEFYKALRTATSTVFDEHDFYLLNGIDLTGNSVISLSPAADKLHFNTLLSVIDDITKPIYGYEFLDANGNQINSHFLNSFNIDNSVTYRPKTNVGIYCASFFLVQKEHIVVLNNSTMFNDTIYNPASGYKQDKIKVSGYVSSKWNASLDVPGFIVDQAKIQEWAPWQKYAVGDVVVYKSFYYSASTSLQGDETFDDLKWVKLDKKPTPKLMPNWNYKATQFTDFYSLDSDNFDVDQQRMAQHLTGYQKRQYLENIIQDDVSEYKFYQGMIIEKGTQNVLNKLFDVLSSDSKESLKFYEEWAIRTGQYGACSAFDNIEFVLDESLFKTNPQGFELVENYHFLENSLVIQQTPSDIYVKPIGYSPSIWPAAKSLKTSTVYARIDEVAKSVKNITELLAIDISTINNRNYILCTFDKTKQDDWNVYQYIEKSLTIESFETKTTTLEITVSNISDISAGMYVGIKNAGSDSGVFLVTSVNSSTRVIVVDMPTSVVLEVSSTTKFGTFISRRTSGSIDNSNYSLSELTVAGQLMWTDNDANGTEDYFRDTSNWKVWENNPVYTISSHYASSPKMLLFGRAIASTEDGEVIAISHITTRSLVDYGEVSIYTKSKTQGWVLTQILTDLFANPVTKESIASTLALSNNGEWLAIGSPAVDINNCGIVQIFKQNTIGSYSLFDTFSVTTNDTFFGSKLEFGSSMLFVGTKVGKVYRLTYDLRDKVTTYYKSLGSVGTTLKVGTTAGIEVGMFISGRGLTNYKVVTVVNSDTLTISAKPALKPSGSIIFSKYEWQIEIDDIHVTGGTLQFGSAFAVSTDNTLVVSDPFKLNTVSPYGKGQVHVFSFENNAAVHELTINAPTNKTVAFGKEVAISKKSKTLAISVLTSSNSTYISSVNMYLTGRNTSYQSLVAPSSVNTGEFGSKLLFTNDDITLAVGSLIIPVTFNASSIISDASFTSFISNLSASIDIFDRYESKWVFSERLNAPSNVEKFGQSISITSTSVIVGAPGYDTSEHENAGKLYEYSKQPSQYSWTVKNKVNATLATNVTAKPDIRKIKQAFLYNKRTNTLVKYLDVIDPIQDKHANIAERELKYKSAYDPAIYSYVNTSLTAAQQQSYNVDAGVAWNIAQVGSLWWDLRTAKFFDNFTDSVVYRNSMVGMLAPGASVDIYEWVESELLPSEWDDIADTEAGLATDVSGKSLYGDKVYSEVKHYDTLSQITTSTYYYWVKNKTTVSSAIGRSVSASEVSSLISNPKGAGYEYLALTGLNSFSLVNVKPLLTNKDIVLSVEYWKIDKPDQNIHSQWKLISSSPSTVIPNKIEQKWFDSLCGKDSNNRIVPDQLLPTKLKYGIENRPRQSMFVNRFEALKQLIEQTNICLKEHLIVDTRNLSNLKSYDTPPSEIKCLYDIVFDTDAELRFAITKYYKVPELTPIIVNGRIVDVTIVNSGKGYLIAPFVTIVGTGNGAVIKTIIDITGQISGIEIINSGEGYQSSTALLVRSFSVLILSDSTSNNKWSIYSYAPSTNSWNKSLSYAYDTTKYWNEIDWYATGYSQFTTIHHSVDTYNDLNDLNDSVGDRVKIRVTNSNRWVLLEKYSTLQTSDWTQTYKVIGSQNGTIQFSSLLYNFNNTAIGFDGSIYDASVYDNYAETELRIILNAIKDDLLIDDLKSEYLNLFLTSVRYAMSEQTYIDWIFKTSFVNVMHNVGNLRQTPTYKNDNLSDFESYVSEVKPYRTQVREYISSYDNIDINTLAVSDFDLPPIYDADRKRVTVVDESNSLLQTYPWKHWLDNVGYSVTDIQIIDGGTEYLTEPLIRITSTTGSGATARAFIVNKKITRIKLLTEGSGYKSTPIIEIIGGYSSDGTPARAVAILGNSVIRTNSTKLKFDRIHQHYLIDDLQYQEELSGVTGTKVQFTLKWIPDITAGKTTVVINGITEIRDKYTMGTIISIVDGHPVHTGVITFKTAPLQGSVISVSYYKNSNILNATDRIQYFYKPGVGELGKDLPQVMDGIDYAGVIVSGLNFDVVHGWDSVPFYTDTWDNFDPEINDVRVTVGSNFNYELELPFVPIKDSKLNVYFIKVGSIETTGTVDGGFAISDTSKISANMRLNFINTNGGVSIETTYYVKQIFENVSFTITDTPGSPVIPVTGSGSNVGHYYQNTIRLDDPNYVNGEILEDNVYAMMVTPIFDGISNIVTIPDTFEVFEGDTFIVRKETSDGAAVNEYDSNIDGGKFVPHYSSANLFQGSVMGSAFGVLPEDIIVDGDNFHSNFTGFGPEEMVPGQVVDTLGIKVYNNSGDGAFMQFKDMNNTVDYRRLNARKKTRLVKDLHFYDTTITVEDSSSFDFAAAIFNTPGVIYIEGERIEYFSNDNNVLSNLRRGTMGTGVASVYKANTVVQEIGKTETIVYKDDVQINQYISDGTHLIDLSYAPSKSSAVWTYDLGFTSSIPASYGQTDEIEVFVGGYKDNAVWESNLNYAVNDIVRVGEYVYRCLSAHTSSNEFKTDRTKWGYFVGNVRLKKSPYKVHNINLMSNNDVQFDAEFSVNGKSKQLRLTNLLTPGTLVTVVRKKGQYWAAALPQLITFINAEPGSTYETRVN